jgi:hypothetical protein
MRRLSFGFWTLCALALAPLSPAMAAEAGGGTAAAAEGARPTLRAGTLGGDLVFDGRLDDPAWAAAADSIAGLTTIEPREGGVPVGRTVVKVLANPREIVIGLRCDDPNAAGLVSHSKARDSQLDEEDHVTLVFDTFLDGRSGYVFTINPSGARSDGLVVAQGEDVNTSWDAIWEARTALDAAGWSAEIRIPIRSLSFGKDLDRWGFNVERRIQRIQETSRWAGASRDFEVTQTTRSGVLASLPPFDLGLGLSVRPALVTRVTRPSRYAETDYEAELSLDATKTLGSNLLSALTINTDFAETEVDARQINLTRFPLFFPEKRTFFLEGSDIFEFGLGLDEETLIPFYSRRIGLFGVSEEDQVEVPIDVGAKIAGRIGETQLGGLVVGTRPIEDLRLEEEDLIFNLPRTTMGAVRMRRNLFEESSVGLIGTFGDQAGRHDAWTGGADFIYRTSSFHDDQNFLVGAWGLVNDRVDLHGEKSAFGLRIDYPNDPVDINFSSVRIGDGFDPSLGFVPRNGVHIWDVSTTITPRPWWPGVRELTQELNFTLYNRLDNASWQSYAISARPFDVLFHSGARFEFAIEPEGDRVPADTAYSLADNVDIPTGSYEWTRFTVGAHSAEKRRLRGHVVWESGDYYNGRLSTVEAGISVRASDLLTFEVNGERNTGTLTSLLEGSTGDSLAKVHVREDLISVRVEVNVSSDLQFATVTQYDTDSRELGSNNRLRWTFRPKGDLFVVYNYNALRTLDNQWHFKSYQLPIKVQYTMRF